ncbi:MAG: type II toxin-antitoxin system HipA family toxin [Betaproteobacteria bacterium]
MTDLEWATLRLARECGLTVPQVGIKDVGVRRVLLVRRFDRYWAARGEAVAWAEIGATARAPGRVEKRLGFVSGLTLVGCDESESIARSYADLARAIERYCHRSAIRADLRELFSRMVFNVLVSNDDDHLRNHGFVFDTHLGGWRLSPLYDVVPRPSASYERTLHLGVGTDGRAATIDNALTRCQAFGLSRREALGIVSSIWAVVGQWRARFDAWACRRIWHARPRQPFGRSKTWPAHRCGRRWGDSICRAAPGLRRPAL